MHNCEHYLGYPLPALLYDAKRGASLSAYAVYYYFVNKVERGETPGKDVLEFVSGQLKTVLEGKQSPRDMIHKNPGKRLHDYSEVHEQVIFARAQCSNLDEAYPKAAIIVGDTESNVKKQYKIIQKRINRILHVQDLLDTVATTQSGEIARATVDELNAIYSKPIRH